MDDLKRVVNLQYRIDNHEPTAWPEFMSAVIAVEEENPKLRSRNYMIEKIASFFVSKLKESGKSLRYSSDVYRELIAKFVLMHDKPLIAAIAAASILDFDDPTETLEDGIRFSQITMGAKFSTTSVDERRVEMWERAKRGLGSEKDMSEKALRAAFDLVFDRALLLESQNLSFDELIEFTFREVCKLLRGRTLLERSRKWYRDAITYVLAISEEPQFVAVTLIEAARRNPNPTEYIEISKRQSEEAARYIDSRSMPHQS